MKYASLNEMFWDRVATLSDRVAYQFNDGEKWVEVTWKQYGRMVRNIALSFVELGLGKGDKICVISNTRPPWDLCDKAVLYIGGVTVGIYQTIPPNQVEYIITHSDAKAIIIEDKTQFEKVVEIADHCPNLKHLIVIEPKGCRGRDFIDYDSIIKDSAEKEEKFGKKLDELSSSVGYNDMATLIYTSGTTGPPKGAIISHFNLLSEAKMLATVTKLDVDSDATLTWLPMAHIYQRAATLAGTWAGIKTSYAQSIEKLLENLADVKPTIFYSVPRIFEKAYAKIIERANDAGFPKKNLFHWSMDVGTKVSKLKQLNKPVPFLLQIKFNIAQKLVFGKIKKLFGGRIRFIASSAAPIARNILEFFHAADICTLEAYGATETTAAITVNTPEKFRFGSVGWVPPGMEIKIADDGEIMVKGDMVFGGYYKDEDMTKEVLSENGWYATGDVGEMDEDGFLRITDRKKDIIVTSGGKNVAPQNIEGLLKNSKYISQALVHGDKRKYLTALITLDPAAMEPWAKQMGLPYDNWMGFCESESVKNLILEEIKKTNSNLAKFETIKYFQILHEDFTIESGELTPTMKLKRKIITERYMGLLDSMYKN